MCCPVDASRNVPQLLSNKNKVVKKEIWTGILSHETQTLFIESPSSLVQMFYGLQWKITCCSDGTLARDASPEPWAR